MDFSRFEYEAEVGGDGRARIRNEKIEGARIDSRERCFFLRRKWNPVFTSDSRYQKLLVPSPLKLAKLFEMRSNYFGFHADEVIEKLIGVSLGSLRADDLSVVFSSLSSEQEKSRYSLEKISLDEELLSPQENNSIFSCVLVYSEWLKYQEINSKMNRCPFQGLRDMMSLCVT